MSAPEDILTLKEATARLRISRRTLGRLISEGLIPAIQLSAKRIGIESADLDNYIARRINDY